MTFIVDPLDEETAIDTEDGDLMGSVRMLPLKEDGIPPAPEEFEDAPIVGYVRPDAIS